MSWRDNLVPASWRNIDFYIDGSTLTIGRRVAVHEFVQRDNPFIEDLGRKNRTYKVKGYLVANKSNDFNHWEQRDSLIRAVETGGVGKFSHPYYGELNGHITDDFTITEEGTKKGGFTAFEFTFVEGGEETFERSYYTYSPSSEASVGASAEAAYDTMQADFNESFSVDGYPSFVLDSATSQVGDFLKQASQLNSTSATSFLGINTVLQTVQQSKKNLENFVRDGVASVAGVSNSIVAIVSNVESLGNLESWALPPVSPFKTLNRMRENQNSRALRNIILGATVTRKAELAARLYTNSSRFNVDVAQLERLVTIDEMQAGRLALSQSITSVIEDLSTQAIFDPTQAALVAVRTASIQHITAQGETLARTFETSAATTTAAQNNQPAIVVAYRHYGALLDASIIERNGIEHPLFIQPNRTLSLLATDNQTTFNGRV